MAQGKSGIHIKPENRGKLRASLHVGSDEGKIPMSDLMKAKRSPNSKTRARANFALASRKWSHA